jgi:hypothetical protein
VKVWLAYSGEYEDRRVEAVFADRGSAVRCWAENYCGFPRHWMGSFARDRCDVEEFELQVAPPSEQSP